ncbi:MAG TPA: VIT1/CCC1 transporter family protein [Steroidobacteraceae bacterium]|nr:VIT1/CCC1 transporter family protein [Steroidobacteraceae bacterium]
MTAHHENWFHERESAWLYRHLARHEPDPRKQQLFNSLADAAERQALRWNTDGTAPAFVPTLRARIMARLLRWFGPRPLKPALAAMKLRGLSVYDAPPLPGHPMPTSVEQIGLRHRRISGSNLRAAVFGVNDGLVSNTSLIMGVAGSGVASGLILPAGVAGLLAGALSMAAGEYVSVRSQREMYEYQIGLERDELEEYPEEEAEELALIYNARGMELGRAREASRQIMADPQQALQALAREELGINPDDLASPWGAAISSFISFAVGALLPLLPFLVGVPFERGLVITAASSAIGLFAVGMAISLFTGRAAWRSGARMVLIGAGAALVTWLIGRGLGVMIG